MKRKTDKPIDHNRRAKKLSTGSTPSDYEVFEYNSQQPTEDASYSQADVMSQPNAAVATQEQYYSYNYTSYSYDSSQQGGSQDLAMSPPYSPPQKQTSQKKEEDKKTEQRAERMANEERERMKNDLQDNSKENKDLYSYFNDLQAIANEHRVDLHFPELVVVGMQSDGKSSFVEALLGFQFNTIDTRKSHNKPL